MNESALREHLAKLLDWGDAHMGLSAALEEFPEEHCSFSVPGSPHTPWRLLEHMRIAQRDILEFSRTANHTSPDWPEGYWPEDGSNGSPGQWQESVRAFLSDLREMQELVRDESVDLAAPIPHGDGQTVLREALLAADHNAYHLGQLMMLRRAAERSGA